jgi:phage tail sheath protein FI
MPTYKTPDVYVEEISLFPPSVAEVETAIPAFIGYTERAKKIADGDLLNIPMKVKSLLDFETYFGKGPRLSFSEVQLDENNNFIKATFARNYCLYDSMRLFFDNGGGNCYVVAVGGYGGIVSDTDLKAGVDAVRKYDEPTILLFPDAAFLTANKLGSVQQTALAQCGKLGDRVAVLDTRRDDPNGVAFRDNIGINNLKYGAAYSPWLQINYPKNVSYGDVKSVINKGGTNVGLDTLTTDPSIQASIKQLDDALGDITAVETKVAPLRGTQPSISARYNELVTTYKNAPTAAHMQDIFAFLYSIANKVDEMSSSTAIKNPQLIKDIKDAITNTLSGAFVDLISMEEELDTALSTIQPNAPNYTPQFSITPPAAPEWNDIFGGANTPGASHLITAGSPEAAMCDAVLTAINKDFGIINGVMNGIVNGASQYVSTYDNTLYNIFPVYKNIILGINDTPTTVPPSGAVAGVYASVDEQRGVFKAPANTSLAGVVGPDYNFDASETDDLNVDVNAGKSINAIRAFSGKGTLVWGARTLAGNDNEWRYVNVRRFFNMVEESVKKSTYWAVFEANDANTWVKVRGMIENYLTQKWREGALAGATTKEAFFVKCGLGTTMTAQDILEGRMNVAIGMAVVRPAEFIILIFSHKLQTS